MANRLFRIGPLGNLGLWPIVAVLLVAFSVPTINVLWFMSRAVQNERLAVQQTLTEVYKGQLESLARRLNVHWETQADALARSEASAGEIFKALVLADVADTVIIYDSLGTVIYPVEPALVVEPILGESIEWIQAQNLEYRKADHLAAAEAYSIIAVKEANIDMAARATQAQARCLIKAGQRLSAITILTRASIDEKFRLATVSGGRLFAPNAQLLALELMADSTHPQYNETLADLRRRVSDYSELAVPSSQRRFLMERLQDLDPASANFPTFAAEMLAADYLRREPAPPQDSVLDRSGLDGLWRIASPDNTVVAVFHEDRLRANLQAIIDSELPVLGMRVELLPPGIDPARPSPIMESEAGKYLPDWRLALSFNGEEPLSAVAARQSARYLWIGGISVVLTLLMAGLVVRLVGAQVRLARLKNDLVATVSHELKTPLASVRAAIDTLLEGRYRDETELAEYLKIGSEEAERLTRLIDNFLTFSRIEGNKQTFEFDEVDISGIVDTAYDSIRKRFDRAEHRLTIDVAPDLPKVVGDSDALVTVLDNLLENAYKYSGDEKLVTLRAYAENGNVCLEVEDNGIGLSRAAARKVFNRFYQVDQTSTRSGHGCGLGLSIVKFIVAAHGGTVSVESEPESGSVFKVTLPAPPRNELTAAEGR